MEFFASNRKYGIGVSRNVKGSPRPLARQLSILTTLNISRVAGNFWPVGGSTAPG